jgi:beta-glucosidase
LQILDVTLNRLKKQASGIFVANVSGIVPNPVSCENRIMVKSDTCCNGAAFPKGFLWGTATSAYQVEGGACEGGRSPSVWDAFCRVPGKIFGGHTGDVASDHYHKWREDVALMKAMNQNAYRFSLSWSRIMPEGVGRVNEEGVAFYDRLIDSLLEAGIEPWVTLFHWDLPLELHYRGGWLNPDISKWFADYSTIVAERFSDRVKHFITVNEPQCYIGGSYAEGKFAPGIVTSLSDSILALHNALLAHGRGVQALRAAARQPIKVGHAAQYNPALPLTDSPDDISAARQANFAVCPATGPLDPLRIMWAFALYHDPIFLGSYPPDFLARCGTLLPKIHEGDMETISQPLDFLGLNIYWGEHFRASAGGPEAVDDLPGCARNAFGWPITPSAIYWGAKFCEARYGRRDIYITENGTTVSEWPTPDGGVHDPMRIDYLRTYLGQTKRCIDEGLPIKGYFVWSLIDNFEWAAGYSQRFGLVHVDYATQKRTVKDSGRWYAKVAASNGASLL